MNKLSRTRKLTTISLLSAISSVLMIFLEFPLPFIPAFYKLDFSELPALIGGFSMGPLAGMIIELIKVIIKGLFKPTPMAIGEIASFVIGSAFVCTASLIYKYRKTFKGAILALFCGVSAMSGVACIINAFVLLPAYAQATGMNAIISEGTRVNDSITDLLSFTLLAVLPFNLIKGTLISIIVIPIYKRISVIIKQ